MVVYTETLSLKTRGEVDIIDITSEVERVVSSSGVKNGIVVVFNRGSTGAISTIEYEPGLIEDLPAALERLFPKGIEYKHHLRWHDGNGHSHIRATFLKPSLSIPVVEGSMPLGTWQQIVFIELDVRPRERNIIVQVVGE